MSLPIWMTLHVKEKHHSRVRLRIPLFLVWILLLPFLLLAAVLIVLAAVPVKISGSGPSPLRFFPLAAGLIWNLPGLHIDVEGPDSRVLVSVR